MAAAGARRVVVGIGNPDRGDDGVGRIAARRLRQALPDVVEIAEHDGEATSLLDCFDDAATAILIDACASGAPPGTVHRIDAAAGPLPSHHAGMSSHGFGPAEAVELARALGRLPPLCLVYAIEAASFETGAPLSPAVRAAVDDVIARVRDDLGGGGDGDA